MTSELPQFQEAETPLTVAQLILLLQNCPQEAPVYMPDVGCGCCSYYAGVGVDVTEGLGIHEIETQHDRVVLFGDDY
jgi:hypothetical protein